MTKGNSKEYHENVVIGNNYIVHVWFQTRLLKIAKPIFEVKKKKTIGKR